MDHFPNRRWTWNILETTGRISMGAKGIPLSTFLTELAPQLLGWKIDNPSGNFAALVANAQSFIAQEPPPSHRMNHKFPDWKFEGLKNLRPRFPPDISGGSYSRSKFAREIRCSSSRRLNIHTFYILICIEICIRFVIKKFCKCEITKCWGFLKLWYCQLLRSLSYFEMFSNYLTDRVWSKKMI